MDVVVPRRSSRSSQCEVFPGGMVPDGTAGFIGKKFNMRMKKADMIDWEDIDPADYSIRVSYFSGYEMIRLKKGVLLLVSIHNRHNDKNTVQVKYFQSFSQLI